MLSHLGAFLREPKPGLIVWAAIVIAGCASQVTRMDDDEDHAYNPPYAVVLPGGETKASIVPAAKASTTSETFMCPKAQSKPMKNLILNSFYDRSDPFRADVDEDLLDRYQEDTRELRHFEKQLVRMANRYVLSGNSAQAACVASWLEGWARGDALLGKTNTQGEFVRQWTLASLSSAWLQVRKDPSIEPGQRKVISGWLSRIARVVIRVHPDNAVEAYRQNNHLYWAAWAVTVTGVALGKSEFYEWGVGRIRHALEADVAKDGTLIYEMDRGKKALQYHIFALTPLVMVAETAMRNGDDLYDVNDGALHKVVKRVLKELQDPGYFEAKTGFSQDSPDTMSLVHYAWMDVYQRRYPQPVIKEWLARNDPVVARRAGGDMTLLFPD